VAANINVAMMKIAGDLSLQLKRKIIRLPTAVSGPAGSTAKSWIVFYMI
jgi:hypothetical protein